MRHKSEFAEAEVEAEIRAIGARFDPDVLSKTRELYRIPVKGSPWAGRQGLYDIHYGDAERHRLDIYPADTENAPVLLFLHGGGFVAGDKRGDEQFYGNVGRYFSAHGFLTILANYRLAPNSEWPSGNEDVAAVLDWIDGNAAGHGGNSEQVVAVGQSAGAAHLTGYLFDPRFAGRRKQTLRAAALMSGFYLAKDGMFEGPRLYYGEDAANWPDRSPVTHVTGDHPPLLLTVAEFDPAQITEQSLDLAYALNLADGHLPQLIWFEGHNHVSTVHSLGLGRDPVGIALRDFAARHVNRSNEVSRPGPSAN